MEWIFEATDTRQILYVDDLKVRDNFLQTLMSYTDSN